MNSKDEYEAIYGATAKAHEGKPHGWIQWKGTDVCVDLRCECGEQSHYDGEFAYHWQCKCGRQYALSPYVMLLPLTPEQAANKNFKRSDD